MVDVADEGLRGGAAGERGAKSLAEEDYLKKYMYSRIRQAIILFIFAF